MEKNELSRVIEINENILDKNHVLDASNSELRALAERFELHEIKSLHAEYVITPKQDIDGAYLLSCQIKAHVVKFLIQKTEELITINDKFDVVLLTEDMARNNYEQLKDFDIEIFDEDKKVDIGEIIAQYLSLCIFM